MKTYILFFISFFISISSIWSQDKSFKDLFYEASGHLENIEYASALPILLQMEKMDDKNYNTLSSIGYCYLQTPFDKEKAIHYFDKVLVDYKNLNAAYEFGNHKEKKGPAEVIRWMGQAYHANYKFEEALEKYQEYKELVNPNNEELLKEINTDIAITRTAIEYKKNPTEIVVNKLDILNTEYSEYRPKLNGDETEMYFTSRRPFGANAPTDDSGMHYEDIYYSKKKNGKWTAPIRLDSPVNTDGHDACLYISPDGKSMIIYRTEYDSELEGSIYETHLENGKWTAPALMIAEVNSSFWETDANISADGNTLLYTSDKPGGQGGRDIWIMKKLPTGDWAKVQNIGDVINTSADEEAPYLHPDGKTLYFSSKGHKTMGGFDVCVSTLQEDGTWSEPINLGYPINTPGDDVFYFPTNDGKHAYFSSFREGGKGQQDIYMIDIPSYDLKTLAVYKGLAQYTDGKFITDLDINIEDASTSKTIGNYSPNSSNGTFLFILQPGETFYVNYKLENLTLKDTIVVPNEGGLYNILKVITLENGELVLKDAEMIDDVLTVIKDETITEVPDNLTDLSDNQVAENLDAGKSIILNDLYFVYDKDVLIKDSKPDLTKIINYMKKNPNVKVVLEGHTDYKGAEDYNQKLSDKRASRVKNSLVAAGISKSRISTKGFGKSNPIAPNENADGTDNPEGRQKNRRVEIKIEK